MKIIDAQIDAWEKSAQEVSGLKFKNVSSDWWANQLLAACKELRLLVKLKTTVAAATVGHHACCSNWDIVRKAIQEFEEGG